MTFYSFAHFKKKKVFSSHLIFIHHPIHPKTIPQIRIYKQIKNPNHIFIYSIPDNHLLPSHSPTSNQRTITKYEIIKTKPHPIQLHQQPHKRIAIYHKQTTHPPKSHITSKFLYRNI